MWKISLLSLLLPTYITFVTIDAISRVPVLMVNGSCAYFNETIPSNENGSRTVMTSLPCEKVTCFNESAEVLVVGCPPPEPYLKYLKDNNAWQRPDEPWPSCCPKV